MNRSPIQRRTRLRSTKTLAPVSRKQARRNARYDAARARVFERDDETCQRCGAPGTECHHMAGRIGAGMYDESLMVMLCSQCHREITENPREAYRDGWSVRRVT